MRTIRAILRGLPILLVVLTVVTGFCVVIFAPFVASDVLGKTAGWTTLGIEVTLWLLWVAYLIGKDQE